MHGSGNPRLRLAVKIVAAAVGAVTSMSLFAVGMDMWHPGGLMRTVLFVAVGVMAFASSAYAAAEEYHARVLAGVRDRVAFVLRALAFDLQDATGLDVRDLGATAYVLRRSHWPPWRVHLNRMYRERAAPQRHTSRVRWRPGKGVIGRCVAEGKDIAVDLTELDTELARVTRDDWPTVDPQLRLGLSWHEYQRVRGKSGTVLATPILDDTRPETRVVGCVVLDAPPGTREILTRDDVRERVATAATAIQRLVL